MHQDTNSARLTAACKCTFISYKSKYEKVGVLPIWIVKSTFRALALRQRANEGSMLETLDFTFHIGSTPTVSYFDLYLYSAYAANYVYYYVY